VAAPRSGSTLLFETLAASDQLVTVGGEAHWLVESVDELRVGAPGVDSIGSAPTLIRLSSRAACMPRCPKGWWIPRGARRMCSTGGAF